jgi:EmrB/QacA subfamily drug resistance transporter
MLLLDVTIVNVALPEAVTELHASFSDLQWIVDSYVLVLAAFLLAAGTFADRFGRRRVYCLGLAAFGAASLACGLAPGPETLIVARVIQGLGAASMFAVAPALINETYQGKARGLAFGVWGGVSAAAAAAGPVVGGVLTHYLGWRWIFLVNVPISVVAVVLALRVLPRSRGDRSRRLDLAGTALFTVSAGALVFGLIRGNEIGWGSSATLAALVGSVIAFLAFLLTERSRTFPVVRMDILRDRAFAGVSIASVAFTLSAYSCLLYVSLQLQANDHLSPLQAGLVLAPLGFAAMVTALAKGRLLGLLPVRVPITAGLLMVGTGSLVMAGTSSGPVWPLVLAGTTVAGAGTGLVSPMLAATAVSIVPRGQEGMASAVNAACRQLGTALGIAGFGALFPHYGLRALFLLSACIAVSGAVLSWILLRHHENVPAGRGGVDHQRSRS